LPHRQDTDFAQPGAERQDVGITAYQGVGVRRFGKLQKHHIVIKYQPKTTT
jgi:hypothetical protein